MAGASPATPHLDHRTIVAARCRLAPPQWPIARCRDVNFFMLTAAFYCITYVCFLFQLLLKFYSQKLTYFGIVCILPNWPLCPKLCIIIRQCLAHHPGWGQLPAIIYPHSYLPPTMVEPRQLAFLFFQPSPTSPRLLRQNTDLSIEFYKIIILWIAKTFWFAFFEIF